MGSMRASGFLAISRITECTSFRGMLAHHTNGDSKFHRQTLLDTETHRHFLASGGNVLGWIIDTRTVALSELHLVKKISGPI